MKKVLKKFMAVIAVIIMFVTILPLNFKHAEAADDSVVITFKSKLLYDTMVDELRNRAGIYSVDDTKFTINAKQTVVDKVTSIYITYYTGEKITLDLTGIEYFKNCTSFSVTAGSYIDGRNDIVTIPDLTPVTKLTNLKTLVVKQAIVEKVPSLQGLKDLYLLKLSGIQNLDVGIISGMTSLKTLHLLSCDLDNEDVKSIGTLTSLEELHLGGLNYEGNNISDITPLKNLTNLTELYLSNNNISDISPLKGLTKINRLSLRCNNIKDLSPLSGLTNLYSLNLGRDMYEGNREGNPITSMEPIVNLPIVTLSASCCNIKDISFINKMATLDSLDLTGNSIEDFSPLEGKEFSGVLKIYGQEYTAEAMAGGTLALPESLAKVLAPTYVCYDETAGYSCYGCQISSDYKTITIGKNVTTASITIKGSYSDKGLGSSILTVKVIHPLRVKLSSDSSSITLGNSVKLTATASGGYEGYKYSFLVKNEDTNSWYRFNKEFTTNNTLSWTAKTVENRTFYAEVKDNKENVVRSEGVSVNVNERAPLSVKTTVSATDVYEDDTVKLIATAAGGSEVYTYSFLVYNSSTKEWYRFNSKFTDSNTLTWKAGSEGTRVFYSEVKDTKGKVVRSSGVSVNVKKLTPLSLYGISSKNIINTGDQVTITGKASGGKGNYTYSYLIYNPSTKAWYRANKVFTASNTYTWKSGTSGARVFYVEVKDAGGSVVRSNGINVTIK